ncbi:MAG: 3-deoxy-D-manno-octulosonic-acid transferase [Lysobacterales bacterium]|jgi:3-deoxy-D-manno-octulosonic-acid transferase
MRFLYSIAFYLSIPFILLHFALRGLKDKAYLGRWKERFAYYDQPSREGGIVIHAASVGELNAAESLIRSLAESLQPSSLTITTFTPTGSARAQSLLNADMVHFYAPLDLPGAIKRFFEYTKPRLLIIMETEIWPNLLHEANSRNIPVLMANARMSGKSFISYRRFSSLTEGALSKVNYVAAQSNKDLNRLVACGVNPDRIQVVGNMKFDLRIPPGLKEKAVTLRQHWNKERPVIIAGSTHAEDDIAVLTAFGSVLKAYPDTLLILVPRHPERFIEAADLSAQMGYKTELFSNGEACSPNAQCFVIDAMGVLQQYYACSDIAIIGGSFGPVGGHNPLEAAAVGVPIIVGPHTDNIAEVTDALVKAGAAIQVDDFETLASELCALIGQKDRRQSMGKAGKQMVLQGQGALQEVLKAVNNLVD